MPWHYPSEYQHFINTVSGHCILMGRVNWESNLNNSILLSRVTSLVVSRSNKIKNFLPADFNFSCNFFSGIQDAINFAKSYGEKQLFIIGGEQIYQETLPQVDRIYYSEVDYEGDADRFFPEIDTNKFLIKNTQQVEKTTDSPKWKLTVFERR